MTMPKTIGETVELIHRAKTKIERAKRNKNLHEDIEIMEGLVSLVECLQEALRDTATISTAPAITTGKSAPTP